MIIAGQLPLQPRCPSCARMLDSYSGGSQGRTPRPGDYAICLYCGAELVYDELVTPRAATAEESAALHARPRNRRLIAMLAKFRRERGLRR